MKYFDFLNRYKRKEFQNHEGEMHCDACGLLTHRYNTLHKERNIDSKMYMYNIIIRYTEHGNNMIEIFRACSPNCMFRVQKRFLLNHPAAIHINIDIELCHIERSDGLRGWYVLSYGDDEPLPMDLKARDEALKEMRH